MKSLLLFCSGVNRALLSKCGFEENNYVGMGGAVLFTTALAFLSGTAFGARMLHLSGTWSLLMGLVFALGIFNIDRWLVATLRLRGSWRMCCLAVLPRLLFSLVFSLVISDTLVLVVYDTEINNQLAHNQAEARRQAEERLASSPDTREQKELRERRNALQTELGQRRAQRNNLYQAYVEEAEGISGSGRPGKGIAFREKGDRLQQAEGELKTFAQTTGQEIGQIDTRLNALRKRQEAELNRLDAAQKAADGPMAREEALLQLTLQSPWLAFRRLLLEILIVALDCMPVLCKLMVGLTSRHACEALLEAEEEQVLQEARVQIDQARDAADLNVLLRQQDRQTRLQLALDNQRIDGENQRIEREKQQRVQQSMADAEYRLAESVIQAWEDRERQNLAANLDAYIS